MNNSIQAINKLQKEKMMILEHVYAVKDLDEVYKRQSNLSTMAISIYSDAAQVMMPALIADGLQAVSWANISSRLSKLNFSGVPTAAEIRSTYKQAVEQAVQNPKNEAYIIRPENDQQFRNTRPEKGQQFRATKKEEMPGALKKIAAFGFAIPLILELIGGQKFHVLVRILQGISLGVMVIEIIRYFDVFKNNNPIDFLKAAVQGKMHSKEPSPKTESGAKISYTTKHKNVVDYESMYIDAINQVKQDNVNELNRWFRDLKRLTQMELAKANNTKEE